MMSDFAPDFESVGDLLAQVLDDAGPEAGDADVAARREQRQITVFELFAAGASRRRG